MNTFLIIINIAVLLLLMYGLFVMQKKYVSSSKRVFAGLGLGRTNVGFYYTGKAGKWQNYAGKINCFKHQCAGGVLADC